METMMAQAIASAPFLYYSPDPNAENRYHGHFTPHPGAHHQQMPVYPVVPMLPSTPVYSRPGSSSSQPALPPRAPMHAQANMVAAVSPRPVAGHKPSIVLETELREVDGVYYPCTPPLSSSSSSMGSPKSCDMLQTPLNPMFSGLDGVQAKPMLEEEGSLEKFPALDWSKCASPPMTPVYLQQTNQAAKPAPVDHHSVKAESFLSGELLSATSCPSLSPSPTPYAQSVASEHPVDFDFCDPRNLTVGNANSALASDLSEVTSLVAPEEDEHKFLTGDFSKSGDDSSSLDFGSSVSGGLPSFDELSDLESDEDFVNRLVQLDEQPAPSSSVLSRSRASSDALSLGGDSFFCDEEHEDLDGSSDSHFHLSDMSSPPSSLSEHDGDEHQDKKRRTSKKPAMNVTSGNEADASEQQQAANEDNAETEGHNSHSSSSSDGGNGAPAPTPARRGRKQSLTEDPTKTFICDICNRRFRRQEHLKRHYRSLHTQEKPFACNECGKTFSRSDNLAQHARTHGSGAIALDFIGGTDPMTGAVHSAYNPEAMMAGHVDSYSQSYGQVLFQIAAEMPGSASEISSDDDLSDRTGGRKRKRSD